jgi:hypothetical protein
MILAAFVWAGACSVTTGSGAHVNDARLARLSADDRAALVAQERPVDQARSNVETAKVALSDAEKFRSVVKSEKGAAEQRLDAATKSLELARSTDPSRQGEAQTALDVARQRRDATVAKARYADSLIDLRRKQLALRDSELALARADLELARVDALAAKGLAGDFKRNDFVAGRDKAQAEVNERNKDVERERGSVEADRRTWDAPDVTPDAPPPPQPID